MTSKFTELAIDCADPDGLARFWCAALGYEMQDAEDGVVIIGSPAVPEGKRRRGPVPPALTFVRVPEGKAVKTGSTPDRTAAIRAAHTSTPSTARGSSGLCGAEGSERREAGGGHDRHDSQEDERRQEAQTQGRGRTRAEGSGARLTGALGSRTGVGGGPA